MTAPAIVLSEAKLTSRPVLAGEVGVVDTLYDYGDARRQGIACDGTNEYAKLANLWASIQAVPSIRNVSFPPGDCNVGNVSGGAALLTLTNVADLNILARNTRFICNTTDSTTTKVLLFNDCARLFIRARGTDTGYNPALTWRGAHLVYLYNATTTTGSLEDFDIRVHAENMLSPLTVDGTAGARIRRLNVDLYSINCYYGSNFQNNGDGVRGKIYAFNARRVYFPYGVTDHQLDIRVEADGSNIGSNCAIPIARQGVNGRDTTNLRIRASFGGILTNYGTLTKLTHVDSQGAGAEWIDDIGLEVNVDRTATIAGGTYVGAVTDELSAGGTNATTAAHYDRIRLSGNAFNNATTPMLIASKQATEGSITLDPSFALVPDLYQPHWPGFAVRTGANREARTIQGNLTTQTIVIPLAGLDGMPFILRVKTTAADGGLAAANSVYREDIIDGWNPGGGAVGFTATNLHTINRNTAPGVVFTATGETIVVSFTGAAFTGANCFARVEVEYDRPPRRV